MMMGRRCCTNRPPRRPSFFVTAALVASSSSSLPWLPIAHAFGPTASRHFCSCSHPPSAFSSLTSTSGQSALVVHVVGMRRARQAKPVSQNYPNSYTSCAPDIFPTRPSILDRPYSKRYAHSQGDTEAPSLIDDTADLPTKLREAYEGGDTDGIMAAISSSSTQLQDTPVEDLIQASIDASDGRSGLAASILNGLLGSCVLLSDVQVGAQKATELIERWEIMSKEEGIHPDLVSYCLVYGALHPIIETDEYFADSADEMLEKARRLAKKIGGTKYRKAIAKARRKGGGGGGASGKQMSSATDFVETLQEKYGSDFNILREDDDIIVVSKPSGMVCYHQRKTTAGKVGRKKRKKGSKENEAVDADISLVDALVEDVNLRLSTLNPHAAGIVHRIDRGTSGCIALAKTDEMHALLVAEFFTRGAKKTYEALVPALPLKIHKQGGDGVDALPDSGEINLQINNKSARSQFQIAKRFGDDAIRIQMETFTGRKHQVRRHAAEGLSRPLFLDAMYWEGRNLSTVDLPDAIARLSAESSRKDENERFFLHASSLRIPKLGIEVEAPLPHWWQEVEKELS